MRVDVYLPILLSLLLAAVAPFAARRPAPAQAAPALAAAGGVTAAASTWALLLLVGTLFDDFPPVVAEARHHRIHIPAPVPDAVAVLALAALALGLYRALRVVRARRVTRRALQRLSDAHATDTELIVAASPTPRAFAIPLPGRAGRIFVTSAMLSGLHTRERQVLLAHERAHLLHHHDRLRFAADVTAAVNPLLVPLREAIAFLLERWADEQAAEAVGDRPMTARALARAALLAHRNGAGCALAFSERFIIRRVAALQDEPPRATWTWIAPVLGLAALPVVGAADATQAFVTLLFDALAR